MRYGSGMALAALLIVAGCDGGSDTPSPGPTPTPTPTPTATPTPTPTPTPTATPSGPDTAAVTETVVASLDNPWAMTFLPDGKMLVTEKAGRLRLVTTAGVVTTVTGTPAVIDAGQGGLLDVAIDPAFASNRRVYLSFTEAANGGTGLAVARGVLATDGTAILDLRVIWRQVPKIVNDTRHFGGRMAFASDQTLYITSSDRHQGAPAQDNAVTLGKIVRINRDGSIPSNNPFATTAGANPEIWSLGHRNPYGLVFTSDGKLFESEMGPEGGDEFNLITRGANYGWRVVSEGDDSEPLPRHATRPEFAAPLVSWTPVIAPAGMIQYTGSRFNGWYNDFVLATLIGQGLVRVRVNGTTATEVGRIPLGARIREVEQGPDGAIWVLEDGTGGRLLKLDPA